MINKLKNCYSRYKKRVEKEIKRYKRKQKIYNHISVLLLYHHKDEINNFCIELLKKRVTVDNIFMVHYSLDINQRITLILVKSTKGNHKKIIIPI